MQPDLDLGPNAAATLSGVAELFLQHDAHMVKIELALALQVDQLERLSDLRLVFAPLERRNSEQELLEVDVLVD